MTSTPVLKQTPFVAVGVAAAILILSAQVSVPLPFSPVPITLQTLGVMLVALVFGFRQGTLAYLLVLALAALGLGVLAEGADADALFGPTGGYLAGMLVVLPALGWAADRGWCESIPRAIAACFFASIVVIAPGLWVLSGYVPSDALLDAGLWPFLPGNVIKCVVAGSVAPWMRRV